MSNFATTKLSSKGQVVIPEEIRDQLGLRTGDQFVVIAEGDVVILKSLNAPSMKEFDLLIRRAIKRAKKSKLTKKSINQIIKVARRSKSSAF